MKYLILLLLLTSCGFNHNFDDIDVNIKVDTSQIRQACEESLINTEFSSEKEYTATLGDCVLDNLDLIGIDLEDIDDEEILEIIEAKG